MMSGTSCHASAILASLSGNISRHSSRGHDPSGVSSGCAHQPYPRPIGRCFLRTLLSLLISSTLIRGCRDPGRTSAQFTYSTHSGRQQLEFAPLKPNMILLQLTGSDPQAAAQSGEHAVAVFIVAIGIILLVGRLLGELMQRIGQPAVMGQLLAGVIIGQSVLGAVWPSAYRQLFAAGTQQKNMVDAIAQLGVLMLLLLTGMETDLGLI